MVRLNLNITLDLPGLESHKIWVQVFGAATALAAVVFAIVIALGWGRKPKRSADWWHLKNCTYDIGEEYQPIVYAKINNQSLTQAHMTGWLAKMKALLDSQNSNSVLLENDAALEHWRRSQNLVRQFMSLDRSGIYSDQKMFFLHAEGVMKGVLAVEVELVLLSDEPGSPNPKRVQP